MILQSVKNSCTEHLSNARDFLSSSSSEIIQLTFDSLS